MRGSCVVATRVNPAVTLTLGIVLTPFAGNRPQLGVPGLLSPDRLLITATVLICVLRSVTGRGEPLPPLRPVHILLALAAAYATGSALVAQTAFIKAPLLKLVEAYGYLPFVTFYLAPIIYATERARRWLLIALIALGAYLGITTLLETTGPSALVLPSYINNPAYGIHFGRGRGPFVDAVANGFGLYSCALAAFVAVTRWRGISRLVALAVAALCIVGTLLTLERSVWIGVGVSSLVVLLAVRQLRRIALPVIVGAVLVLGLAVVLIPGLSERITVRANDRLSVWDRQNLTTAAVNMIAAHPLTGVGWARFQQTSGPYFQQNASFPLSATGLDIHNYFLSYAAELGIPGALLWSIAVLVAAVETMLIRGPPELDPWRTAFIALTVCFLLLANFVPPTVFSNQMFWLWAGIIWGKRVGTRTLPHTAIQPALS